MTEHHKQLLEEGRNIWRRPQTGAMGLLVDGQEYFRAARRAMMNARRRIIFLAWEFHSQVNLLQDEGEDDLPVELGPFLDALLDRNESLEVYILVWDYSLIFIQEREWQVFSKWWNKPHPRLHLVSDKTAPGGASHHQKILTIDDRLAFNGGMDLSIFRWDTTEHRCQDDRRADPNGEEHDPYHDVQALVDGDAAVALCDLAKERWTQATGEELKPLSELEPEDPWPDGVPKTFENIEVGITRITASPHEEPTPLEQLHLDLFAAARDLIFIENQYYSSRTLNKALAERLREKDGPVVVIILPRDTSGWLVESTIGLLRDRLLEILRDADEYGRLRVYAPVVTEGDETKGVYVHAKVLVIDDRILKIGSANLSNRSMSMDSECDLTLVLDAPDTRITQFRQRLLAMHCGMTTESWAEKETERGSVLAALDEREGRDGHQLEAKEYRCDSDLKRWLADTQMLDPEDPIDPDYWVKKELSEEERPFVWRQILSVAASLTVAVLLGFAIVWVWGQLLGDEGASSFLKSIQNNSWAPLIVFLAFVIGGSLGVPLNFMLVTTAVVLGSAAALLYGISGALLSSVVGFFLGRWLGKHLVRKFGSKSVETLSRKLGERSFRSVAFIRLIPVAPFFLVNMVAGASHLKFKQYLIGTILGMTPGMVAVVFLANRAEAAVRSPGVGTILTFLAVVAVLLGLGFYLKKILLPAQGQDEDQK